jgi:hypothetical protein
MNLAAKTEEFQLRLSEAEELQLYRLAHAHDMSLNQLVNQVLLDVAKQDPSFPKRYEPPAKASSSECQLGLFD